jgi:hypothetical protein
MLCAEGTGHRIVSSSTKTGNDPKYRHQRDNAVMRETMAWQEDDHESTEYSDDEFFSVDNITAKRISKDTKKELSDNHAK